MGRYAQDFGQLATKLDGALVLDLSRHRPMARSTKRCRGLSADVVDPAVISTRAALIHSDLISSQGRLACRFKIAVMPMA